MSKRWKEIADAPWCYSSRDITRLIQEMARNLKTAKTSLSNISRQKMLGEEGTTIPHWTREDCIQEARKALRHIDSGTES